VPDYDEYFERAQDLDLHDGGVVPPTSLPVETARGCWWGAKHHCVFCGLNGTTMEFRAKSPERVVEELSELASRYRTVRFEAVDNILDTRYLKTLLPQLADSDTNYEIFYEVKANLTRADLKLLRQAGVAHIQPGLESLSSQVLKLMRKGVSAAQNVNLLRWARYYGITVSWNVLWGFPGETGQDYIEQAAVVPHLVHLQPPDSVGPIWLERFSPLYTEHSARPEPASSYRYIFPSDVDLDKVAYFFEYAPSPAFPAAYDELTKATAQWCEAWRADDPPRLSYWSAPHYVQIYDDRHKGAEGTYEFHGALADLYLGCVDRPITAAAVRSQRDLDLPVEAVEEAFCEFQRRGLLFVDGARALALAIPAVPLR
jgi:ribosomal peptide maturation radical SAM protein 1